MSEQHTKAPYHILLLAGDQVYADSLWDQVNYLEELKTRNWRGQYRHTTNVLETHAMTSDQESTLKDQLRDFYERLYIDSWADENLSLMLSSVASVMMWDDHDIVDGYGSYRAAFNECDVMKAIFAIAREYFEIFQVRTKNNSALIKKGYYSQHLSFRNMEIFALDNRSFRTQSEVMSATQYNDLREEIDGDLFENVPEKIKKERMLCFVIPVPLAHLNYSHLTERLVAFSWLNRYFRKSLHDDVLDHWDHPDHEKEQERLLDLIFYAGQTHRAKYVCIVSGDVHTAGAAKVTNERNQRITQLVSSGTVHAPPGLIQYLFIRSGSRAIFHIGKYKIDLNRYGTLNKRSLRARNYGEFSKEERRGFSSSLITVNGIVHRTLNLFIGGRD